MHVSNSSLSTWPTSGHTNGNATGDTGKNKCSSRLSWQKYFLSANKDSAYKELPVIKNSCFKEHMFIPQYDERNKITKRLEEQFSCIYFYWKQI